MKKVGYFLVFILIVLTVYWIWIVSQPAEVPNQQQVSQQKQFEKQTDEQAEVSVEVTPVSLQSGQEIKFSIAMDTHTVELNFDLLKVSKLITNTGKTLTPLSWSGGSGGHHLRGELIFPAVDKNTESVELILSDISNTERRFKWKLS